MHSFKTLGFIIKRKNFVESDRILTIYSYDFGKIELIARGARKILSKLGGFLELFYFDKFYLSKGRNFDIITGVEAVNDYKILRQDREKINQAYYISELVNRFTAENDPNYEIFNLLKQSFDYLDQKPINPLLLSYFSIRLISYTGHNPQLVNCAACEKKLKNEKNYFNLQSGGVICGACAQNKPDSFFINNDLIKILRLFAEKDITIIDKIKINIKFQKQLQLFNKKILEYTLGNKIKSSEFI